MVGNCPRARTARRYRGVEGFDGVGAADDFPVFDVVVQEGHELAPGVEPEPCAGPDIAGPICP